MKRYKVSWTELKPVYHEAEITAAGQNDAARIVETAQKFDSGEKTIIDVKFVGPEGEQA